MGDIFRSDISYLKDYFPLPCECIRTTGIGDGIILKFKTFYLKIYDADDKDSHYIVKAYLYGNQQYKFFNYVQYNKIRSYASLFKNDDYLQSIGGHFAI